MNPNESKMNPNESKKLKLHKCEFCEKVYSTNSNLHKHIKKCRLRSENHIRHFEKKIIMELIKDRDEMRKEINKLLDKVGNVTNNYNTQQNVYINTHGQENLSYITTNYLQNLLKIPYGAVPKLIKDIHFHPEHPENMNIKITNKKLKYAKVWEGNKWNFKDKNQVIENMVEKGFNIIDQQYSNNKEILDKHKNRNFDKFKKQYEENDKKLHKELVKDTEMIVINNS